MTKIETVNCKIEKYSNEEFISDNLLKVKLTIMHEGENEKGSFFSLNSMKKAEKTLTNIPILAYFKKENDKVVDFDQHNTVVELVKEDNQLKLKEYYLEKPIGIIPESCNPRYEEIEGITHLVCDGYIWKSYSNEGYSLIMDSDEKGISMEISIDKGYMDIEDGLYHVEDYNYLGVTVLGDHIEAGMGETAKLTKYSLNNNELKEMIKEINNKLKKLEEEVFCMTNPVNVEISNIEENEEIENVEEIANTEVEEKEEETVLEENDVTEETIEEPIAEDVIEEETTEEPIAEEVVEEIPAEPTKEDMEKFSLTINSLYNQVENLVKDLTFENVDYWGEIYNTRKYWIETILINNIVVLHDNQENKYYGAKYTLVGDELVLDLENKTEFVNTWREKQVAEDVLTVNVNSEKQDGLKEIVLNKFSELENELKELREFKASIEKEELAKNVDEIILQFSLNEEDIEDLKNNVLNNEISLEQFQKELYALEGMKIVKNRNNYSKQNNATAKVKIALNNENKPKPYGNLFG